MCHVTLQNNNVIIDLQANKQLVATYNWRDMHLIWTVYNSGKVTYSVITSSGAMLRCWYWRFLSIASKSHWLPITSFLCSVNLPHGEHYYARLSLSHCVLNPSKISLWRQPDQYVIIVLTNDVYLVLESPWCDHSGWWWDIWYGCNETQG
jgi:hypothetical protein